MHLQSILRRVQPLPGFVYDSVELRGTRSATDIHVHVRARAGSRAICGGCGKKRPGYDTLGERRFAFVPLWGMAVFFIYAMRRVDCLRCGVTAKSRGGGFWVIRRTSRKKRRAKLAGLREELRRRRHKPIRQQYRWLCSVLRGHDNYYGVPGNIRALTSLRYHVRLSWYAALQRRSQRGRWNADRRAAFDRRWPLPPARITRRPSRQLPLCR